MVKTLSDYTKERKLALLKRVHSKYPDAEFIGFTEVDGCFVAWYNYAKPDARGLTTGILKELKCIQCSNILTFPIDSKHGYCTHCNNHN